MFREMIRDRLSDLSDMIRIADEPTTTLLPKLDDMPDFDNEDQRLNDPEYRRRRMSVLLSKILSYV